MHHAPSRAAWLLMAALPAAAAAATAAPVQITEFKLPNTSSGPAGIAPGPDGNLWFTELFENKIGRISTAGAVTGEFAVPGGSVVTEYPAGIAAGPDGNLWFTELTVNLVGRITTAGVVTQFSVPTANADPADIARGPDGNFWFTEAGANKIGRITPAGAIKEFPLPAGGMRPLGIAAGPDGNLWFTVSGSAAIGRVSPQGAFQQYLLPDAGADPQPAAIAAGPDGNLWFTELNGNNIGRITPSGAITEFGLPTPGAFSLIITAGPDGNLWLTELNANNIARITTAGGITEVPLPTAGAQPGGITVGPDGNVWFTEIHAGKIGRVQLAGGACAPGATTLCIDDQPGDHRWQVTETFHTAQAGGVSGNGNAIPLGSLGVSHGGLFWFFGADNPEMLLKVLNACSISKQFWIFYAATTNVGFTVDVKDTRTGRTRTYTNRDGTAAPPVQDTAAFACSAAGDLAAGASAAEGDDPAGTPAAGPDEARLPAAAPAEAPPELPAALQAVPSAACASSATSLCIDGRFLVQANFHTKQGGGRSGSGQAISLQNLGVAQGGLFWFFSQDNPEMLIKVINGCSLNQRFWVFYAAGTNVGFTVTVTDTQTGHSHSYMNTDGKAAPPVQDTSSLPCH